MLLQDYLKRQSITKYKAAQQLGVTWHTLWRWCTGRTIPQPDMMAKVRDWSGGKVTPNDWIKAKEKVAS